MKRIILVLALALTLVACDDSQASQVQKKDAALVGEQNDVYQQGQPVPIFNYSQSRATLIEVYKAKTSGTATFSYVVSYGKLIFSCPSIGYPIPATTQLTNPEATTYYASKGYVTLPQAEPDGTYTGTTNGTYVLCVREDGKASPYYTESEVNASSFELKVVDGVLVDAKGKATITVETKR